MPERTCSVDGCESRVNSRGLCNKHYLRWRIHGDPLYVRPKRGQLPIRSLRPGERPPASEPRRYKAAHGYVRVRWQLETEIVECYEHRWVMGIFDPALQVHHRNGVRDDNRPENLEVLSPRAHGAEHRLIDRAEVVRLYVGEQLSTPEVGRLLGCSAGQVYRILKAEGVTPRTLSESQRLKAS